MEMPEVVSGSESRPADVFITPRVNGKKTVFDVSVVSPTQGAIVPSRIRLCYRRYRDTKIRQKPRPLREILRRALPIERSKIVCQIVQRRGEINPEEISFFVQKFALKWGNAAPYSTFIDIFVANSNFPCSLLF